MPKKPPAKRQRKMPDRYLSDIQSSENCYSWLWVAKAGPVRRSSRKR
jgi:hypothetical protein